MIDLKALGLSRLEIPSAQPSVHPSAPIEPWMKEFVKGRHSQEEWDVFFAYVKASRWQRVLMWLGGIIFGSFGVFTNKRAR